MWTEEAHCLSLDDEFLRFMPFAPRQVARVEIKNRMLDAAATFVEDESDGLFDRIGYIALDGRRIAVLSLNDSCAIGP